MSDEVLIKVDHVSKKFCRDLKTSLWYGIQDITSEILGIKYDHKVRPKEFWSVNDVSFELRRGECLGLIGSNGSGKSTLLKMLNGLIKPDKGRIEIKGRVGALIELGAGFNPILTGRENIYANGSILGFSVAEIDKKFDAIVEFAEIKDFIDTPIQNYSSGMKVKLGFAVAAQMEPDVLIIDEVLAVGDVGFRAKCFTAIYNMIQNAAVVMVTHQMPQISRVCSDIMVLNKGICKYQGKNVAEGIEKFYSYFERERKQIIYYTDQVVVHEVELESKGEKDVEIVNYLDELIVNIDLSVDSNIEEFTVNVFVLDQELQYVTQCNSFYNQFNLINTGKRMQVALNLGQINLNPGLYSLSIEINSKNYGIPFIKGNCIKNFKILGNFVGSVPIQLFGQWNIQ